MAENVKKGIWATGYQEGEARGKVKERSATIIDVLGFRFHRVPKPVKDKISSITNMTQLKKLTQQATKCPSLDAFVEALNEK